MDEQVRCDNDSAELAWPSARYSVIGRGTPVTHDDSGHNPDRGLTRPSSWCNPC